MDSRGKRRRVDDRLSDLPDCLLDSILSSLGSRQAVRTSLLSRRWRHLWRNFPSADIHQREFAGNTWERFAGFVDHVLTSIPQETQLDAFRLHLVRCSFAASDSMIRPGLQHNPTTVDIRASSNHGHVDWRPYRSVSSDSRATLVTSRLTTLHLVQVKIMDGFTKDLREYCPALEKPHMERCDMYINVIASPLLRSLVIISPSSYGTGAGPLRLEAPHLISMRIELPFTRWWNYYHVEDGVSAQEPLALLADVSIRLTGLYKHHPDRWPLWQAFKVEFLKSVCSFLAFLPNVAKLHLSGFTAEPSLEFPVLHNLKSLVLEECGVGTKFQILTSILLNTPTLEKLGLHQCIFLAASTNKGIERAQEVSKNGPRDSWCKKLKCVEIKLQAEDEPRMLKVLSEISWWQGVKISWKILDNT